ncbi:leucine-rich repeat protein [Akkermansiaceae bacterium]|nr:leucine-rich repeat protein [Akkermansiaceae bacterium]
MIRNLSILILLLGQASGFTVSFLNVASADNTAVPILDNNGDPIALGSGFVAAGTFATLPGSIDEVRLFTPFGEGNSAFSNSIGVGGFFDGSRSAPIPAGSTDAPVNQSVYLVIGDGADLASSTDFAVFDPGLVFGTENAFGAGALDIIINSDDLTEDSLVYGRIVTSVDTGLGVIFSKGIKLGQPLSYSTIDGKVTVTDCDEAVEGEIVIPNTIGGNPVTSIANLAFYGCRSLTSITIPDSVTSIGTSAFYNCTRLASITIPDTVTSIASGIFRDCTSLQSITIPSGVTSIGGRAFYGCINLLSITIPDGVNSIGINTFYKCTSLTSVIFGTNSELISIGNGAFARCTSLTSITIPNSVTSIRNGAFEGCSTLASIAIPDSVNSIGASAFLACFALTEITIPDGVTSIETFTFGDCNSLASVTIPDSVTTIKDGAFQYCTSLTSITIPDSVTSIGTKYFPDALAYNGTFSGCSKLTSITIPDSVSTIGTDAFYACTSLASITIPESVTSISYRAFDECTSLTKVTFLGAAPEAVASFNNVADGAVAYVKPEALSSFGELGGNWNNLILDSSIIYTTTDGKVTITDCSETAAGELIIPDTIEGNPVTSIGIDAFAGCISLTSIIIPNSVTSIEIRAFDRCVNLTSVTIPDNVTRIANGAFRDCISLPSITIPESVTSIGIRAFYNCTSLASITIPESVTSIEDNAFGFCSKLTSVTIPESVTLIGRGAFIRCSSLINISVDEGNLNYSSIDGVLFTKAQGTLLFFPSGREGSYSIPDGVTSINSFAFDSCLLTEVIIPEGVTSIGIKAFQLSSQLTSIVIPEGVTSIEPETFRESTNLVSATLPSSVTAIGTKAFAMCSNLMEVVLEGPAPEVQSDAFASIADGAKALARPEHVESYGGDRASWEGLTVREISPPLIDLKRYYESLPDETVSIDATAIDGITDNYDYQWVFNGFPIPENLGGTAAVQVINGIDASEGKWKVVVTNRFGKTEHSFDYRILLDTDEDGLSDGYEELVAGTNPELSDTDEDGLSDFDEIETHNTDPLKDDSDGDGFLDGFELANKSAPLVASSQPNLTLEMALSDINGLPALKFETSPIVGGLITIEQSSDLKTWAPVVFFNGEGVAYETTVIRPPAAKSVYRLKVLDQTQ